MEKLADTAVPCKICAAGACFCAGLFSVCDVRSQILVLRVGGLFVLCCGFLFFFFNLYLSIYLFVYFKGGNGICFQSISMSLSQTRLHEIIANRLNVSFSYMLPKLEFGLWDSKTDQPPHYCCCLHYWFTKTRLEVKCILFLLLDPKKSVTLC